MVEHSKIFSQITRIERSVFGPDAFDPELWLKIVKKKNWGELVLQKKGVVHGYYLAHYMKDYVMVHRLVTNPSLRKRGVGAFLMDSVIVPNIPFFVHCPERWVSSQKWLHSMGWRAVGVEKDYFHKQDSFLFRFYKETEKGKK